MLPSPSLSLTSAPSFARFPQLSQSFKRINGVLGFCDNAALAGIQPHFHRCGVETVGGTSDVPIRAQTAVKYGRFGEGIPCARHLAPIR